MSEEKTSIGLAPNVAAAVSYVLGFISGIIIYIAEKENRFVRFHAMQSILLSVAFLVLSIVAGFIPVIGWIIGIFIPLLSLICWILAIIKAAQGQYYKFPIIGDFAEKQIGAA